ncbi:hypothetical protein SMICM17S_01652 [Streptomyces microflavus]
MSVQGDPVLLDHLVHNLVANALRHNHPGGTVRVRVGPAGWRSPTPGRWWTRRPYRCCSSRSAARRALLGRRA